jgi:7-cyano-7-deazaguanine synthase in queuosine biosynthesis
MHAMSDGSLGVTGRPRASGGGPSCRGRATRSLVLWSGGLDSTYALLRLLEHSGDEVFSHHVRVVRAASDPAAHVGACQEHAIERLHGRLIARARNFEHSSTRVDLGGTAGACVDAALLAFMAAQAARVHRFTPFDRVLVGVNADEDPGWAPDSAACALRRARLARALRAAWGCDEVPQIYLWEPRPDKAAMAAFLGRALVPATVSCLHPVAHGGADAQPCGACRKCRVRAGWDPRPLTHPAGSGEAARTPPPSRHRARLPNRTPALAGEAAASGPVVP